MYLSDSLRGPRALRKLDYALGADTRTAFRVGKRLAGYPGIGAPSLKVDSFIAAPYFGTPQEYPEGTSIGMPLDEEYYVSMRDHPLYSRRMAPFRSFFESRGIGFDIPEIAASALLHEMGHARQFQKLRQRSRSLRKAVELHAIAYDEEIESLPLRMTTGRAKLLWERDPSFKANMAEQGIHTEKEWNKALFKNLDSYMQTPSESDADTFALQALHELYK